MTTPSAPSAQFLSLALDELAKETESGDARAVVYVSIAAVLTSQSTAGAVTDAIGDLADRVEGIAKALDGVGDAGSVAEAIAGIGGIPR